MAWPEIRPGKPGEKPQSRGGLKGLPVNYGLWPWSSALAHMTGKNDRLVSVEPVLSLVSGDWRKFVAGALLDEEMEDIRKHARTGRPLGSSTFLDTLERKLGRKLGPRKPGRKPREK